MNFSELSLAENDTGFRYDPARLTLYGEKRGYGAAISDRGEEYIITAGAEALYQKEKSVFSKISALESTLPKNALLGLSCGVDFIEIRLRKDFFLQERLPALFDFLNEVICILAEEQLNGVPVKLPPKAAEPETKEKKNHSGKIKLGFDFGSIKGLFGSVIGAAAMVVISTAVFSFQRKSGILGSLTELSGYLLSGAATLLIFSDYRFLARKLDPFGVIFCPILSAVTAVVSALSVTAKAFAAAEGVSFGAALSRLSEIYETQPQIASFGAGFLLIGVVVSGFTSLLYCLRYFRKHPDEMIKNEKPNRDRGASA